MVYFDSNIRLNGYKISNQHSLMFSYTYLVIEQNNIRFPLYLRKEISQKQIYFCELFTQLKHEIKSDIFRFSIIEIYET